MPIAMNSSSNASQIRHPTVLWAQRKDKLLLTVQLENCKDPTIEIKSNSLYFKGKGGAENCDHEFTLIFNKDIEPELCKHSMRGRTITFELKKQSEAQGFWPRLCEDKKKVHFLKTDFNLWKDEDDSDVDEGGQEDFNLDEVMQSMGGMQGGPPMGEQDDEEEDSDDEELPDLQQ